METIFIIAVTLSTAIGFIIARKPNEFRAERSALIPASPAEVFPNINNLNAWQTWSPWARLDPDAKTTFEGPIEGVGAKMSWEGKKTGKGTMTILQSRPNELVQFRLEFIRPMKALNTVDFTLAPEAGQTRVTWTMVGPNSFMGKIMGLFMNCEKMCGDQFNDGFKNLTELIETKKKAA